MVWLTRCPETKKQGMLHLRYLFGLFRTLANQYRLISVRVKPHVHSVPEHKGIVYIPPDLSEPL
jgi:hypothetical protein